MEVYSMRKLKRKDLEDFSVDFSDFSLSYPPRKTRRTDAEPLPPILEGDAPKMYEEFEKSPVEQFGVGGLSIEDMMADTKASDLDREERPEVLSLVPPYDGKSILELGAGVGRFTAEFAKTAAQIVAVELIESAAEKNEITNGHHKNAKFICADVRSPDLSFPDGSFDLIFSNWLLLYLSENEVFKDCHLQDGSGDSYLLSLIGCKCLGAYVKIKRERNQAIAYCSTSSLSVKDTLQPVVRQIQPRELVGKLDLKPGQKVLDMGCGIGGGDTYMAETYDVHVVAIDASVDMVSLAIERGLGSKCRIELEVADVTNKQYPDASFDAIYIQSGRHC
ncbi:hypothetical protein M569_05544 [Genlisea aurea]|uniref:phosphoethanolamine N-methyltransferase n=1 Tax=Genlisea aurea TaxID=192259 RepID=S8E9Q0_9LAMI|nr:hypothetical protein M569_05544 [Genlisea aurea]